MIKYEFLDVGLAYQPKCKFGAAATIPLIGTGVSALAGITSSLIGSHSASRNNAASLSYASAENERQRQWQELMYRQQHLDQWSDTQNLRSLDNKEWSRRFQMQLDSAREMTKWIYDNFDSPQAKLAAFQKAGLNPAMMIGSAGNGFNASMPSMPSPSVNSSTLPTPSGMSSPLMSPPRLENEGLALSQGIESTTKAIANLAIAGKDNEESKRLALTHQVFLDNMLAEKVSKQYAARSAELYFQLDSLNLPKKQKFELKRMMVEINNLTYQGEYAQAQTYYTDMMTKLSDLSLIKGSIELDYFRSNLELQQNDLTATIAMKKAQRTDYLASANQSNAAARNLNVQTETENLLRPLRFDLLKNQNLSEEKQISALNQKIEILKKQNDRTDIENALQRVKLRDEKAYSALHRLFFGRPERGDFKQAFKYFTTFDSDEAVQFIK